MSVRIIRVFGNHASRMLWLRGEKEKPHVEYVDFVKACTKLHNGDTTRCIVAQNKVDGVVLAGLPIDRVQYDASFRGSDKLREYLAASVGR